MAIRRYHQCRQDFLQQCVGLHFLGSLAGHGTHHKRGPAKNKWGGGLGNATSLQKVLARERHALLRIRGWLQGCHIRPSRTLGASCTGSRPLWHSRTWDRKCEDRTRYVSQGPNPKGWSFYTYMHRSTVMSLSNICCSTGMLRFYLP